MSAWLEEATVSVTISTSLRDDEVRTLDTLARNSGSTRAGLMRAMLRYALDDPEAFFAHLDETDGKPL